MSISQRTIEALLVNAGFVEFCRKEGVAPEEAVKDLELMEAYWMFTENIAYAPD